jgi:hypothetical protein
MERFSTYPVTLNEQICFCFPRSPRPIQKLSGGGSAADKQQASMAPLHVGLDIGTQGTKAIIVEAGKPSRIVGRGVVK